MRKLSQALVPNAAATIRAGATQAKPAMPIFGNEAASIKPATIASGKRLRARVVASNNFTRRSLPQMRRNANKREGGPGSPCWTRLDLVGLGWIRLDAPSPKALRRASWGGT